MRLGVQRAVNPDGTPYAGGRSESPSQDGAILVRPLAPRDPTHAQTLTETPLCRNHLQ